MLPRLEISFTRAERAVFKHGQEADASVSVFEDAQSEKELFMLNHCRSGIVMALEALHLPHNCGVGVMAYNCHTVMNAVWQAGLTPIFIDLNNDLKIDIEDLAAKVHSMKALVVTNLFGIINDIATIKELFPDLIIIEDCAHAFAHPIDGDFGVYSIGQGKFPSVGDGGILVVNNKKYLSEIAKTYSTLPSYTRKEELKLYYRLWLHAIMNKPCIYKHITLRLKQNRNNNIIPQIQAIRPMANGIRRLLTEKQITYNNDIRQRKQTAQQLADIFNLQDYKLGENAFMLITRISNPAELQHELYEKDIDSATHFANCINWAKQYGYKGDCPNAELLTKELLMIPIYANICYSNTNNKNN